MWSTVIRGNLFAAPPAGALEEGGQYYWGVTARAVAAQRASAPGSASFRVRVRADLKVDGAVDATDLGIMVGSWGPCAGFCPADVNRDGRVDAPDLAELLGRFDAR